MNYRSASAVIARRADGQLLLVKKPRLYHAWQFPQGGIEPGETAQAAAEREFREEIGTDKLCLEPGCRGLFRYDYPTGSTRPDIPNPEQYIGQELRIFVGDFTGTDNDIELSVDELERYTWITPERLADFVSSPGYLILCRDIIDAWSAPKHQSQPA